MLEKKLMNSILIFSDGACSGNPGKGGWGAVVALPSGEIHELGLGYDETTNNRMEISGALQALNLVLQKKWHLKCPNILMLTDSTYLIRGITQWVWGWRKKGWKNAQGEDVSNRDLWEELMRTVSELKPAELNWQYVRGHVGIPGNERCDEIATSLTNNKWVNLYRGPLIGYSVAIYDLPEQFEPLPEMKPKTEKPKAHSYLSYLDGKVIRHRDWSSCEKRVKGRSGAKFKKALSAEDEAKIIESWGARGVSDE